MHMSVDFRVKCCGVDKVAPSTHIAAGKLTWQSKVQSRGHHLWHCSYLQGMMISHRSIHLGQMLDLGAAIEHIMQHKNVAL